EAIETAGSLAGTNEVPDDRVTRLRARIAAAQSALDERATKHQEQLNRERLRLQHYETELQQKAAQLLEVARENRRVMNRGKAMTRGEAGAAGPDDLDLLIEAAASRVEEATAT